MKKFISLAIIAAISSTTFAETTSGVQQISSKELKAMDCATLSVEKSNAKRSFEAADKNITAAATQTPAKSLSKWAGVASGALSSFGGNSEKATKAGQFANNIAGEQDTSDASNVELQQKIKATSQANLDNIAIYQGSKKCKI